VTDVHDEVKNKKCKPPLIVSRTKKRKKLTSRGVQEIR